MIIRTGGIHRNVLCLLAYTALCLCGTGAALADGVPHGPTVSTPRAKIEDGHLIAHMLDKATIVKYGHDLKHSLQACPHELRSQTCGN